MNPVKIDNPTLQPYRCLFCTSGHRGGPVVDMLVDVLEGRAYICLAHAKRIAITAGFAEGEELERLANAAVLLAEAEKGIAERDVRHVEMERICNEQHDQINDLRERWEQTGIALKQAEDKLTELGQGIGATLAAVGSPESALVANAHLDQLREMGADLSHLEPGPAERGLLEEHARAAYEEGRAAERREAMHGPLADEIKAEEQAAAEKPVTIDNTNIRWSHGGDK